jgi:lipopolysaccharide/colanic/teichoic acid biosynthesis glycosyltransferase
MKNNNQDLMVAAVDAQLKMGRSIRWGYGRPVSAPAMGLRRRSYQSQGFAAIGRTAPTEKGVAMGASLLPQGVLPRQRFIGELQREKRRTDRTTAPLSLALFQFDAKQGPVAAIGGKELQEILQRVKRETDVVGSVGGGRVALLLPDTNEQGAKILTERIVSRAGSPGLSVVTASYPNALFDDLLRDSGETHDAVAFEDEEHAAQKEPGYPLKRALDLIGASIALLLFSPVMLITALIIALTSPGPVIFRQTRIGKRGVPFVFYKFRSMRDDADDRIHREYVAKLIDGKLADINNGSPDKPFYKMKSDPRVTRVGKFIRQTHIDELPQLFNVLKGDMSLVGPRPGLPYEVEKYQYWHLRRILEIRPGITCLWQVNGHNATTFDDMVRLDIRYVRECSLSLDLRILLKTVKVVLSRLSRE